MLVYISSDSFVSLVSSSAESYRKEVGGLLFGDIFQTKNKKLIVHQAIPLLSAEQTKTSVTYHQIRTPRVTKMWDDLSTYWPIGEFHSHPESKGNRHNPSPSDDDIKCIKDDNIELIVSIRKSNRRKKLGYKRREKRIAGSVRIYDIEMACWQLDDAGTPRELELWCPFIDVINWGYRIGLVGKPGSLFAKETFVLATTLRKLRKQIQSYENYVITNETTSGSGKIKTRIKAILKTIKSDNEDD